MQAAGSPRLFGLPHRREWLALQDEPVLEPNLPIVDAHHHLWSHPGEQYLLDDLCADTGSGHRIVATVYVQCGSRYRTHGDARYAPVGETEFASEVARTALARGEATRCCDGIVGYADLRLPGVDDVLAAHQQADPQRFKGIRQSAAWDEDARLVNASLGTVRGLYADAAFRRGFARLAPRGLSFDAWALHPQLDEVIALARDFPDTVLIVDHIGAPVGEGRFAGRHAQIRPHWLRCLRELAACPNVRMKIGGLGLPILGMGFSKAERPLGSDELARQMLPWVEPCIEAFGANRCLFESNFPVDAQSFSYQACWNAFKRLTAGYSDDERAALFHGTAARCYRLDLPPDVTARKPA